MPDAYFLNPNGSFRDFTQAEIDEMEILTRGVRDGSNPTWVRENGNTTVRTTNFCKFEYFERFMVYMLGAAKSYIDSFGVKKISRLLPQRWPGKPKIACVRLDSAKGYRFTGGKDLDGRPTYDKMECEFTWQLMPFAMLADADTTAEYQRYTQILPSQGEVQYLNLPGGTMQYYRAPGGGVGVPHGRPIPYSIGFPEPKATIPRKWIRVPRDCWGEGTTLFNRVYGNQPVGDRPFVGTVNNAAFLGYPPGYLLYLGVEEELRFDELGDEMCWDLTHKWQASYLAPHTWKYFFSAAPADAAANGWYFTAKAGGAFQFQEFLLDDTALHNARDHRLLFAVG